jgi:hypothetical protein
VNGFVKKFLNLFNGRLKEKRSYFSYDINYDGDIGIETAKQLIIQGIDLEKILKQCNLDNLDAGQKSIVLEEIGNIVNIIEEIC